MDPPVWIKQARRVDGRWQHQEDVDIAPHEPSPNHGHPRIPPLHHGTSGGGTQRDTRSLRTRKFLHRLHYYFFTMPLAILSELFLPRDYPHSVHSGYLEYQLYDSIQGLCSYVRGTLSTSAILTIAGVGDAQATSWGAAMQWAMKDGMGMMGGLVFSYFASSHFDSHVKEFRLFADAINDVGLFLDLVGPTILIHRHTNGTHDKTTTHWIWILSSVATLCRVMCGMAAGATKGSITQHFSKHNLADLNSKEGTQETLVSLLGMILGIFLARYLQQTERVHGKLVVQSISWWIFSFLTLIHVWANYRAVSILRLRTLNPLRAEYTLEPLIQVCTRTIDEYLDTSKSHKDLWTCYSHFSSIQPKPLLRPPDEVNEPFLTNLLGNGSIQFGSTLQHTFQYVLPVQVYHELYHVFYHEQYLVCTPPESSKIKSKPIIHLRIGATDEDTLKAFAHALIVRSLINRRDEHPEIATCIHKLVNLIFEKNILSMGVLTELGWDSKLYFPSNTTCRLDWGELKEE